MEFCDTGEVKGRRGVNGGCELWCGTLGDGDPRVGGVLGSAGCWVLESVKCSVNVSWD
jgi:hypothetical protein